MVIISTSEQVTHALSVSLNKIGDLKYHDGDLQTARSYYNRSLNVRQDAIKNKTDVPSQVCITFSALIDLISMQWHCLRFNSYLQSYN